MTEQVAGSGDAQAGNSGDAAAADGAALPTFDAWALPPDFAIPRIPPAFFDTGGVRVRYLDADPQWVRDLADTLRAAGARLAGRSTGAIADALGTVGERLLDPDDSLRREALRFLPSTSGMSEPMAAAVLDGMAADWTANRLRALLERELGEPGLLDRFIPDGLRRVKAFGPALAVQVLAGSVPGVGTTALLRSLLVKSPVLIKAGRGDIVLPALAVRALGKAAPDLAAACAVVYWPGGRSEPEDAALLAADFVAVYGSDETVRAVRARTPVSARFVAYHHRVSLAVVGREALSVDAVDRAVVDVAGAVAFFDQHGCVSPHVVYVEEGGGVDGRAFATRLAGALASLEETLPGGVAEPLEAARLQQLRGAAEMRAAAGPDVELHHGGADLWTVIFEADPSFETSCLNRTIRVKPVDDLSQVAELVRPFARHLQTIGVAGVGDRLGELADALGRAGAVRVAPLDSMPFPPPWWHHDGQGPLTVMLRFVDVESER